MLGIVYEYSHIQRISMKMSAVCLWRDERWDFNRKKNYSDNILMINSFLFIDLSSIGMFSTVICHWILLMNHNIRKKNTNTHTKKTLYNNAQFKSMEIQRKRNLETISWMKTAIVHCYTLVLGNCVWYFACDFNRLSVEKKIYISGCIKLYPPSSFDYWMWVCLGCSWEKNKMDLVDLCVPEA